MYTATISPKFQICIPKSLREELHLKVGQQFVFILHGNSLQLVPKRSLVDVRGVMAGSDKTNVRDRSDRQ